jgi:RNA polymerase sigma-70 factor, ECF subfamily
MEGASLEERVRHLVATGANDGAATEAIRALGPQALRYVRTIVRDEDAAKDAFSLWAEGIWRGLPRFRGEATLRSWSLRLAHFSALAVVDRAWNRRARPLATGEASHLAQSIHTATAVRLDRQRRKLEELTASLNAEERALLSLRIDQRLSWEEIAAVVTSEEDKPDPRTLAKRYERLKARLAASLDREAE